MIIVRETVLAKDRETRIFTHTVSVNIMSKERWITNMTFLVQIFKNTLKIKQYSFFKVPLKKRISLFKCFMVSIINLNSELQTKGTERHDGAKECMKRNTQDRISDRQHWRDSLTRENLMRTYMMLDLETFKRVILKCLISLQRPSASNPF